MRGDYDGEAGCMHGSLIWQVYSIGNDTYIYVVFDACQDEYFG